MTFYKPNIPAGGTNDQNNDGIEGVIKHEAYEDDGCNSEIMTRRDSKKHILPHAVRAIEQRDKTKQRICKDIK
jgi:hypothetical protein